MSRDKGGFYFIATILDIKIELPIDVTPTIRLERATDSQVDVISKSLELDMRAYYEEDCIKKNTTSSSYRFVPLPKEKWRYYIISFSGGNCDTHFLFSIADIVSPHLKSFLHYHTVEEFGVGEITGWASDAYGATAFSQQRLRNYIPKIFNQKSLEDLQRLFKKYNALDKNKHEGILRAIDFNTNLQRLPKLTNLPVLGFFVIIEMLLTHNPNDREIGDSLTHQIKTKIAFLSPRLDTPLNYLLFDSEIPPDKIWGALYEYRSCIAHGNHIDFTKGKLKILRNSDTAFEFLNAATRALLVHAIIEPDVINGLKPI